MASQRSAPRTRTQQQQQQQRQRRFEKEQPLATLEIVERATADVRALSSQDALRVWKAFGQYVGAQLMTRRRAVKVEGFGIFALNAALEPIFLHSAGFLQTNRVRESRARAGVLQVIGNGSDPIASVNMSDIGRDFLPGYSKDVVATVVTLVLALVGKLAKQGRALRLSMLPMGEWVCDGEVVGFRFLAEFQTQTKLLGRSNSAAKIGRGQAEQPPVNAEREDIASGAVRAPEPTRSLSAAALKAHTRSSTAAGNARSSPSRSVADAQRGQQVSASDRSAVGAPVKSAVSQQRPSNQHQRAADAPYTSDASKSTVAVTQSYSVSNGGKAPIKGSAKAASSRAALKRAPGKASLSVAAAADKMPPRQRGAPPPRQAWTDMSSSRSPEETAVLARVKFKLVERCGQGGLNALSRVLQSMDSSGDGVLSPRELKFGLRDLGVELSASELAQLVAALDRNRDGSIDLSELVSALRGPQLSASRLALVHRAFALMDPDDRGTVSIDDLRDNYDVSLFPAVRAKKQSKAQALAEFVRQWEEMAGSGGNNGNGISREAFVEYYENISACIADDSDFELLMRQTWHVSRPQDPALSRTDSNSSSNNNNNQAPPALDPRSPLLDSDERHTGQPATSNDVGLHREASHRLIENAVTTATTAATHIATETERDWRLLRALLVPLADVHSNSKVPTVDDVSRKLGANRVWGDGNEIMQVKAFARALALLDKQLLARDALLLAQRVASSVSAVKSAPSNDSSVELTALHRWLLCSQIGASSTASEQVRSGSASQPVNVVDRVRRRLLQRIAASRQDGSGAPSPFDVAHVGLNGLQRCLKLMDSNRDKRLSKDELKVGLRKFGVDITFHELDYLFTHFDADRSGCISTDEFLVGMRGDVSARRLAFVHQAFRLLDKDGDGAVTLQELASMYDTSKHPDVLSGRLAADEALKLFAAQWESASEQNGVITRREFEDYYTNLSASIDSDDYFELMMRNAWHITGGDGACANSTNRRVLVTDKDGRQRVEEIQNDLGVRASDQDVMHANLARRGVIAGHGDRNALEMFGASSDAASKTANPKAAPSVPLSTHRDLEPPPWQKSSHNARGQGKFQSKSAVPARAFHRRRVLEVAGCPSSAVLESILTGTNKAAPAAATNQSAACGDALVSARLQQREVERGARQHAAQRIQSHFRGFKARKFVECVRRKVAAEKQRSERIQLEQAGSRKKVVRAALRTYHGF